MRIYRGEIVLGVLALSAIVLAITHSALGDKYMLVFISTISLYVAYSSYKISEANSQRAEKSELESISPHFRVISLDRGVLNNTLNLEIRNEGGTMILNYGWLENLTDWSDYGVRIASAIDQHNIREPIFPKRNFSFDDYRNGIYPIYLTNSETVKLCFEPSKPEIPFGTGTSMHIIFRFWDLKSGFYRIQVIYVSPVISNVQFGPAQEETAYQLEVRQKYRKLEISLDEYKMFWTYYALGQH